MKKQLLAALAAVSVSLMFSTSAFAFGAIAVDDEEGETEPGYGFVTGEPNKEAAQRKALKMCKESGNTNCKVIVWFKTCGAYAVSKKYYGYGYGDTQKVAERKAVEMCGQKGCKVVVAECE